MKTLQTETNNIQSLLQEAEVENQITKAKLTEYEQIGVRTSEKIQEVQAMTLQIRKESQDVLELNRKSLKGLEDSNHNTTPQNFDEMQLDEEMRRLEKITRKLEGFSIELLSKDIKEKATTPTHKPSKKLNENPLKRAKTKHDIYIENPPTHLKVHKKMISFGFENINENEEDWLEYKELVKKVSGLNSLTKVKSEGMVQIKRKRKSVVRSKTFALSNVSEKEKERVFKIRAKSFDSLSTLDDKAEKQETFVKEIKIKIIDFIESCEKICEEQGHENDKSGFYRTTANNNKGFDEINNKIRNIKDLFLKYCENLDKVYHQKILKTLELTNNLSENSMKLKSFLQEKQTFEQNLNEILNLIEGKDPKSQPEISGQIYSYEGYLSRLKKIIEISMDDQQSLKSQSLEINDIVNEKNRIEGENVKLKKENQGFANSNTFCCK